MNMLNISKFFIFFLIIIAFSCTHNKFDIDVSGIKADVTIQRLEKDLFAISLDRIADEVLDISKKYGDFFDLYNNKVITIGSTYNQAYPGYLKAFLTDFTINELYKKCMQLYPDLNEETQKLSRAFKYFKYYFPEKNIPKIYSYIGGFNQSVVTGDKFIGFGIDKYLGSDSDFYKRLALPNYIRTKMHRGKITADCMTGWATAEFPFEAESENLINQMLYHGKILYFLDATLPFEHDSVKTGFTDQQLKWCDANEDKMWKYLVEKKLLFVSDYITTKKFIDEAPFTANFSKNSPGKAAIWIGRQIIRKYMENNPGITIAQLMKENNYQNILSAARYKP
ncbi:MAG: hypothetical protein A2275_16685 [Bacteroidetes bacterium RIFOXYA12_FULL_35_11]|nr:MAG: hypothetical protein A2X01_12225 [Bacteroidetes bacterium GWF2_35_48]OFY74762.1 MAG: hypothetical protein A2275_16685 [Bacteroidetes bacterium RIFOXYA12_FULL_35_11]OFY95145.1 MAG: hypothetical protein A2491_21795 [Bacteroidetes bacterium RIFOXYC12_FULL_35_7]OFY95364.1 MAG: hypothetical protein A2309_10015 [Bacteroidetes bacterium RIFOXYB2_FULL_35_7]HBX49467.1 hypothetical protein [Bacteroidales bacterium]